MRSFARVSLLAMVVGACGTAPPPAPSPVATAKPSTTTPSPAPPKPAAPPPAPSKAPAKSAPTPPAVAAAKPPAPPPLDLKTLAQRLKETNAIGVMTKLSLKNQVDDLVQRFKAFHAGSRPPTLQDLRPAYELLLMKVLALLQDSDPTLAHDINASREAIWGVLSDRQKFSQYL